MASKVKTGGISAKKNKKLIMLVVIILALVGGTLGYRKWKGDDEIKAKAGAGLKFYYDLNNIKMGACTFKSSRGNLYVRAAIAADPNGGGDATRLWNGPEASKTALPGIGLSVKTGSTSKFNLKRVWWGSLSIIEAPVTTASWYTISALGAGDSGPDFYAPTVAVAFTPPC